MINRLKFQSSFSQQNKRGQLTKSEITTRSMVAGGLAGMVTKTSTAPLERIKILLQIEGMNSAAAKKYTSVVQTCMAVIREEGALALWKGNGANVTRVVPVYALKFTFNDSFRNFVREPGQKDSDLSTLQLMSCGTSAGLFQTCCTFPLELVRTRLSFQNTKDTTRYKGIIDCFRRTIADEGVFSLYKGLGPTIVSGAPYVGLQMTFYELWKRKMPVNEKTGKITVLGKLTAGAVGGLCAQIITYPGDTVRRRMIVNGINGTERTYTNSVDCTIKIMRNEGFKALFKGLSANVIRCIPGAAIQFFAYDLFKDLLIHRPEPQISV